MKFVTLVLLLAVAIREPLAAQTSDGVPSRTSDRCLVPNVIGLSRADATGRLRQSKLEPGRIETRVADQQAGTVIDQQPRQCGEPTGNRVDLVVSSGQAASDAAPGGKSGPSVGDIAVPVGIAVGAVVLGSILARKNDDLTTVPDLVRKPEGTVDDLLRKARLREGEFTREASTSAPAGTVIAQSPVAGTRVPRESVVNVRVSSGLPMTEVPDVTGLEWRRAGARTTEARLRMLVTEPQAGNFAGMTVTSQTPTAGTRVPLGATVGVALQLAPPVVQVPPPSPSPPPAPAPSVPTIPAAPPSGAAPIASPAPAALPPPATGPITLPTNPLVTNPPATIATPASPPLANPAPAGQPVGPVAVVTPGAATWSWPLFVLLLLGLIPVAERIRKRLSDKKEPPPQVPPIGAPVTCIPRLDSGQQSVMPQDHPATPGIDVIYQVDAGTQDLSIEGESPRLEQIGA